jgi:peptidoglycan/LPS O-acetylase OafA/YrhL
MPIPSVSGTSLPKRFYSLDVLRGVAALVVVLWHWQHFFLPLNKQGVAFSVENQPMFGSLFAFYKYGDNAVQLFFCLSGFIFFWLYSKRIAEKSITFKSFSILRLSRLYPLHFMTLIFVAIFQLIYTNITNTYFVYPFNDAYHFFLNLFFISSWGFQKGYSFNYPIWSVSVEILLYAIFFVFCRIFYQNIIAVIFAIIIGHFFIYGLNRYIASGIECFFLGGIVFIVYMQIIKSGDNLKLSIWLPLLASMSWIVTIASVSSIYDITQMHLPWIIQKVVSAWLDFVLFPMTIMSLALIETKRGTLGKRLAFVGDISYSSYLLHFPLQLAIATIMTKMAINQTLYYSPWFMVMFYFVLILLSLASHRYFEVPMQRILRMKANPTGNTVIAL